MKRTKIGVAVLAALLLPASSAVAQTLYKWTDKDGKVHFSDTPPNDDSKVKEQSVRGGGPEGELPFALQEAMKRNPVILFVGNNCGDFCANGRSLLARRGIPYSERNAEVSREAADALTNYAGSLTVPTLVVGTSAVTGYTEDSWNSALDTGGYPRTKLPSTRLPPPIPPAPPKAPPPPAPETAAAPEAK